MLQVLQKLLISVAEGKAVLLISSDPSFVATLLDVQMRACRVWLLTDGGPAASSLHCAAEWNLPWISFLCSCPGIPSLLSKHFCDLWYSTGSPMLALHNMIGIFGKRRLYRHTKDDTSLHRPHCDD